LDTRAGGEHGPSTMTFAATLVLMDAVAGALGAESHDGAGAAADTAERLLENADQTAETLADWLDDRTVLTLLARGGARAAAEMGALTLKEAARIPAELLAWSLARRRGLDPGGYLLATKVTERE